jgi:hypothetical protein
MLDRPAAALGRDAATSTVGRRVRVTSRAPECEVCREAAVVHRRDDAAAVAVQVWVCTRCGDLKRWCPRCEQGWIRRCRVLTAGVDFFCCDACAASWPSPEAIGPTGTDRETYLYQLGTTERWGGVATLRERDAGFPAA